MGFVLGHLENFVERGDEDQRLRERAREFTPQGDLERVENLTLNDPLDPRLPELVLERLTPFFDSGALIQTPRTDAVDWLVTDVFGRGTTFHLAPEDRIAAARVVPVATPLHVHRAPAGDLLSSLNLMCLLPAPDAWAYLVRPTPTVCIVLVSRLAPVFALDHVTQARRLINQCFVY